MWYVLLLVGYYRYYFVHIWLPDEFYYAVVVLVYIGVFSFVLWIFVRQRGFGNLRTFKWLGLGLDASSCLL
jgi:hypothetical protein